MKDVIPAGGALASDRGAVATAPAGLLLAMGAVCAVAGTKPARAGDFMDTRITWTFGDDNVLVAAGEQIPDSPYPSIGDRQGYELFMDNIDSRYTGRENQTHLVMYKRVAGFFPRLSTEGAAVIQFNISDDGLGLGDDGSYLRIRYGFDDRSEDEDGDGLALVFFPFDTERFRLGYIWDISWGGGGLFTNKRNGFAPGLKLEFDVGIADWFVGFKTARVTEQHEADAEGEPLNVQETNYGALAGVGFDFTDWFRVDLGGGYFQQGTFDQPGLVGEPVYTYGGSLRLALHDGIDVGPGADFRLYRNEPYAVDALAEEAEAAVAEAEAEGPGPPPELAWAVTLEGTILGQHVADMDSFGGSVIQPAYAAALQGKINYGGFSAHLTGFFRNLEFILHNVPSFSPFVAIDTEATVDPEFFAAAGVSYFFDGPRLTPSLIGGVQLPATLMSGGTTVVVRDEETRDILPAGDESVPIFSARLSLRWDLSTILSVYGMVQYVRDENATRLDRDPEGSGTFRTYRRADQLGMAIMTQARF
jgi:opacity protein-like surface antigen